MVVGIITPFLVFSIKAIIKIVEKNTWRALLYLAAMFGAADILGLWWDAHREACKVRYQAATIFLIFMDTIHLYGQMTNSIQIARDFTSIQKLAPVMTVNSILARFPDEEDLEEADSLKFLYFGGRILLQYIVCLLPAFINILSLHTLNDERPAWAKNFKADNA